MTTVSTIVDQALKDANVIGQDDAADSTTSTYAFDTLNQMLANWQVENVWVMGQQVVSFTPTGAVSYTVGSGADVNTTRPEKIDAIYWRSGDVDYPVRLIDTFEQYQSIPEKTEAGEPLYAFYLPSSYTTGTLFLYPQPSSGSIRLITQLRLPQPSLLADTLQLPPEYMLPVRTNLAVLLCGLYGRPVHPELKSTAISSLRALKRNNLRIQPLGMPGAIPTHVRSNIIAGW
jgi:hypothetical protein